MIGAQQPSGYHQGLEYLLLGCGYTSRRVARRLSASGARVVCTNRTRSPLTGCECIELDASDPESLSQFARHVSTGMTVLHSIPPPDYIVELLEALRPLRPARVVYISTTGVYGPAEIVDEHTAAAPDTAKDNLRVHTESLLAAGDWSTLILRPAAIYGPERGVHHSVKRGTFQVPADGGRIISRIHVDDLADHLIAGLCGAITGAFPIADEEPCPSMDVAVLTAQLLNLPVPAAPSKPPAAGRRVDGSAYRRALGLTLRYPSYRQGVPACLAAEACYTIAQ